MNRYINNLANTPLSTLLTIIINNKNNKNLTVYSVGDIVVVTILSPDNAVGET